MLTKNFNESGNQQGGMFFCWVKVSERLEKTMDSEERRLTDWLRAEIGNRVLQDDRQWEQVVLSIGAKVAELNRGRIGFGPYFHLDAMAPTDLSTGFIRIHRVKARHQCMHVTVRRCYGYTVPTALSSDVRDRLS